MRRAAALVAIALVPAACHRSSAAPEVEASAPVASASASAAPALLPARCHGGDGGLSLGDGGLDDLEIGDVSLGVGQVAVGVVHHGAGGRTAAVALLPGDASTLTVRDLGPTLADAPPPRVARRDKDLVAVAYAQLSKSAGRELRVYAILASGDATMLGAVTESHDDSLAYDLAPGLLVWDDATPGSAPRGVIRISELSAEGRPGPAKDASSPTSDAEMPRVQALGAGAVVLWVARKAEPPSRPDGAATAEATGEERAPAWLEAVTVDAHGVPTGPTRRLTSATGHVSAYDVAPSSPAPGAPPDAVLVAVRDDGEAVDGSGGQLLRVRVRADGQDPPLAYPADGLGRGAPAFVDGSPPWLFWVAPREEIRLLPLDGQGIPVRAPSAEPDLEDGRPLALLPSGIVLAATPADASAQLRTLVCVP